MKYLLWLVLSFFSLHHGCSSLLQLAAVITAGLLLLYIPLCYEHFHFHVAHVYARLGYPSAQHILGQRYLQGNVSSKLAAGVYMGISQKHKRGCALWSTPLHC